jgi:hypothetical protein
VGVNGAQLPADFRRGLWREVQIVGPLVDHHDVGEGNVSFINYADVIVDVVRRLHRIPMI